MLYNPVIDGVFCVFTHIYYSMYQVLELAADVLKHVPDTIDYEATYKLVADDMNPLNVVLLQEVCSFSGSYYNIVVL